MNINLNISPAMFSRLVEAVERIANHLAPSPDGRPPDKIERTARKQLSYEELCERQLHRKQRQEKLQPELQEQQQPSPGQINLTKIE